MKNGGKTIWYLYFFGRCTDTFSKNNQKIYNHCYSCTENNNIYGNETPFALFGILKRAFENDQKFDWLSKIILYLTEKHFLLQNKLLNGAHYVVSCRWNCRLPKNSR